MCSSGRISADSGSPVGLSRALSSAGSPQDGVWRPPLDVQKRRRVGTVVNLEGGPFNSRGPLSEREFFSQFAWYPIPPAPYLHRTYPPLLGLSALTIAYCPSLSTRETPENPALLI